jgi:SNW domain-containing protein 1
MLDWCLFNQESLSGSFGEEESYNLYDKPLFHGLSATVVIYKACGNIMKGVEDRYGGDTEEGIGHTLDNDQFGLGKAQIGFEGAQEQEVREGPIQFEKDMTDGFGIDKFLDEAKGQVEMRIGH